MKSPHLFCEGHQRCQGAPSKPCLPVCNRGVSRQPLDALGIASTSSKQGILTLLETDLLAILDLSQDVPAKKRPCGRTRSPRPLLQGRVLFHTTSVRRLREEQRATNCRSTLKYV